MFYAWNQIKASQSRHHQFLFLHTFFVDRRRDWCEEFEIEFQKKIDAQVYIANICLKFLEVKRVLVTWPSLPINFVYSFANLVVSRRGYYFSSIQLLAIHLSGLYDSHLWNRNERKFKAKHKELNEWKAFGIWYFSIGVLCWYFVVEYDTDKSKAINKSSENRKKTTHDDDLCEI